MKIYKKLMVIMNAKQKRMMGLLLVMMVFGAFGVFVGAGHSALISLKLGAGDRPACDKILGELVEGKSRKDIAAAHHITENTVKTHVTHIYEKFKVSSKDALLALVHTN